MARCCAALLLALLAQTATCYTLQQPSLVRGRPLVVQQQAQLLRSIRMQEAEKEPAAAAEAAAEATPAVDFTPATPAVAAQEEGFDVGEFFSKYSITISIFTVFCIVKLFSALGIVDLDD